MTAKSITPAALPLEAGRVRVRRLHVTDLADFQTYRTDPKLARYQGWEVSDDASALAFLESMALSTGFCVGEWLQLGIATREDRLIGDIGIGWHGASTAELGYTLHSGYHGQGLACEAVDAVMTWLARQHHIRRVIAATDARNTPSVRLLQRLNFSLVGRRSMGETTAYHSVPTDKKAHAGDELVWQKMRI